MEMNEQSTDARNLIETAQAIGQDLHKAIAASELQDL